MNHSICISQHRPEISSQVIDPLKGFRFHVEPNRIAKRNSAENSLPLKRQISDPKFLQKIVDQTFPARSLHAQCLAVGAFLDRNPDTVERWLTGVTRPRAEDFAPIFAMYLKATISNRAFTEIMKAIWAN